LPALLHFSEEITMYFEAIFNPVDQKEYKSEAKDFVGKKLAVKEGWIIEDGPYKGQQCYYAPNTTIGRIPQSDLQELKSVPFARWNQIYSNLDSEQK
jgi:hypothetical protein